MQANKSVQISNVITWIISTVALGVASYSLYLQRKDKRPRLRVTWKRKREFVETTDNDERGRPVYVEVDAIEVSAANPTDKQITIESLEYEPEGCDAFTPPLQNTISNIPSHEARQALVMYDELMRLLEDKQLNVSTGRFILTDALNNKHKSKHFRFG
jgi:hypothetical protein